MDEQHIPRYEALKGALASLGPVLKDGALVIVESTIAPGTMQNVVLPLLEQSSGRKLNQGFFLGNCPERVMPGKLLHNLTQLSRVVGGGTPETAAVMVALYRHHCTRRPGPGGLDHRRAGENGRERLPRCPDCLCQ